MGIFELIKQVSFGTKKLSSTIDGKQSIKERDLQEEAGYITFLRIWGILL